MLNGSGIFFPRSSLFSFSFVRSFTWFNAKIRDNTNNNKHKMCSLHYAWVDERKATTMSFFFSRYSFVVNHVYIHAIHKKFVDLDLLLLFSLLLFCCCFLLHRFVLILSRRKHAIVLLTVESVFWCINTIWWNFLDESSWSMCEDSNHHTQTHSALLGFFLFAFFCRSFVHIYFRTCVNDSFVRSINTLSHPGLLGFHFFFSIKYLQHLLWCVLLRLNAPISKWHKQCKSLQ